MGFLNFSKYNNLEKTLLEQTIVGFTEVNGMPLSEAEQTAKEMLDRAIEKSKKAGTYNLPQNFGDIILGDDESDSEDIEKFAENIRLKIPKMKKDGVVNEDIRLYWNLNDVERYFANETDDLFKMQVGVAEFERSGDTEKAIGRIRKAHPIFGDPDDTTNTSGEDRPLPIELKNRINNYLRDVAMENLVKHKKNLDNSSSYNAFVRKEIKAGNL